MRALKSNVSHYWEHDAFPSGRATRTDGVEAASRCERRCASWWSENQINDKDFVLGLEHLVKQDIIQIPKTQVNTDKSQNIPEWIKSTAGWWSEGGITDDEFKNAIQWLIEKGVMTV